MAGSGPNSGGHLSGKPVTLAIVQPSERWDRAA